jgi:DNA-binding MarR family transcriptional regulator
MVHFNLHFDIFNFVNILLVRGLPVTYKQYLTLELLAKEERCLITQLSKKLNVAMSTMTENGRRLVKKDLVKREKDKADKRKVWISLTKKGKEIVDEINKRKQILSEEFSKVLTAVEKEVFESVMQKLGSIKEKYF